MPLETYGIQKLYKITSEDDYPKEFKRMNKELRQNVLNILTTLGKNESAKDVILLSKSILINMHHLLNEYRLVQAKECIVTRLRAQIEANEAALKEIHDVIVLAEKKLNNK